MTQNDKVFSGSIPEIYDRYMVPMFFEPYAEDMARRVSGTRAKNVLETAAGSGVVTRALTKLLPEDAYYTVTDLNQPMLDRAMNQQPRDKRHMWQQADAMSLPFEEGVFDAVCCQFGVMFLPDKAAGFREARRVLAPEGTLIFNVWDHIDRNSFAKIATETAAVFFPDDPPRFMVRTPHGYHDPDSVKADLAEAGFSDVSFETQEKESVSGSAWDAAYALCQGTPLRNEILERNESLLDKVTEAVADAFSERFGAGSIAGKMQAHVFSAVK